MGSTPKVTRDELLTFTEPLGYERSFLLTAWRANLKGQEAMTSSNKLAEEKEFPEHNVKSIEMDQGLEEIEPLHHPISEIENCVQSGLVSDEPEPSDIANSTLSMRKMSPKEEKAMLEKQYFSLMKHAAGYSLQLEEHSEQLKFLIHPVSEWQYIALMNHAAKMYRQLRDL